MLNRKLSLLRLAGDARLAPSIMTLFGLAGRDDALPAQILPATRCVAKALPALMATGYAAALLVVALGYGERLPWLWPAMLAGVAPALVALVLYAGLRMRMTTAVRVRMIAVAAVPLGAMPGIVFGEALAAGGAGWPLATVAATVLVATLIALYPLPVALIACLAGFALAAPLAAGVALLLAAMLLALIALLPVGIAMLGAARAEIRRRQRERQAARRADALIAMLETQDGLWFWETDRHGTLTHISTAIADLFGGAPADLIGRPFAGLIVDALEEEAFGTPREELSLGFYLSIGLGFTGLPVRANLPGEPRWWRLSGQPLVDAAGQPDGFRGTGADITEQRRSDAEANRLARYDTLTGLPNRAFLPQMIEQAFGGGWTNPRPCALMLVDVDGVEASAGALGYAMLKLVAERLAAVVGDKGRAGRLGEGFFYVVLPAPPEQAELARIASEIIWKLSQTYRIDGRPIRITAAVGIAIGPADGQSAELLTRNARLALHAAQADGAGLHRFYKPELRAGSNQRLAQETRLRRALADRGLDIAYQPVVSADAETITGFEALPRRLHPVRGAVAAADLSFAGGETGQWMLHIACLEAAGWPNAARIAVNLSPAQVADPALPTIVADALATAGLDADRLELGIAETLFLDQGRARDSLLAGLRGLGVRLALGGFGTGYSALGYLKDTPFDTIRIDRGLIGEAAASDHHGAAAIEAIISLADALGMESAAAGAETIGELALIRALGFSHIQGKVYGGPMTAAEARDRLEAAPAGVIARLRAPRVALQRPGLLHHAGEALAVRIRNISAGGAQIEAAEVLATGTAVALDLGDPVPMIEAVVRWSEGGRMGIAFTQPFDLGQIVALAPHGAVA